MISYEIMADKLIDVADVDWNGRESLRNSCRYGMEILISMVVNYGLVLLAGLLLGILKEVVIYLFAWGSLRFFSGGRHAANHRRCIIIYMSVMVFVILMCRYLTVRVDLKIYEIAAFIVAFILNVLYAGDQKANQRRSIKNKKIALTILILQFVLVMVGTTLQLPDNSIYLQYLASIITGAALAESLFQIPFHYSKKITSGIKNQET